MSNQKQAGGGPLGKIKIGNAIYPILIGLGVVGYMLWRDFDPAVSRSVRRYPFLVGDGRMALSRGVFHVRA